MSITLKPCSRIILQAADGSEYYSLAWDGTIDVVLKAGSGTATAVHAGSTYHFAASDPAATVAVPPVGGGGGGAPPGSQDTVTMAKGSAYPTLGAALLAIKPGGTVLVADGTYTMAECGTHVQMNATIKAVNHGRAIFDGQQFNVDGTSGKPRGTWQKAIVHVSRNNAVVTFQGIAFCNAGDPSDNGNVYAAVYGEETGSVVLIDCLIDACCDGVFGGTGALDYTGIRVKFGETATNGLNQPGYSHDVYWTGRSATETDCFHYGCVQGHTFKSRALASIIKGGLYRADNNAAINVPQGGTLTVSGAYIDMLPGASANLITLGDDGPRNGPTSATFDGCVLVAGRNPCYVTCRDSGGLAAFTNTMQGFVNGAVIQTIGNVTGLTLSGSNSAPPIPTIPPSA